MRAPRLRKHDEALAEAYENFLKSEKLKKRRKQFDIYIVVEQNLLEIYLSCDPQE